MGGGFPDQIIRLDTTTNGLTRWNIPGVSNLQPVVGFGTQGTCSESGGTVTCDLGDIAKGGIVMVAIEVKIKPFTTGTICNTVEVRAMEADPNPANNKAVACTTVVTPQNPGKVTGGGTITVGLTGKGAFGFNVKRDVAGGPVTGHLNWNNQVTGEHVLSTAFTDLEVVGNHARFSGSCTNSLTPSLPCSFTVDVDDNGEPGSNDTP